MFGFLKKKLQEAIGGFSKKAEKEAEVVEVVEEPVEKPKEEKKPVEKKETHKEKSAEKEEVHKEKPAEKKEVKKEKAPEPKEEKPVEKKHEHEKAHEKKEPEKEITEEEKQEETEETAEKEAEDEKEEKPEEPQPVKHEEKKGFLGGLFKKKEPVEEKKEEKPEIKHEEPKGIFGKISDAVTKVSLSENKFEELFWDLEVILMENNVAVEVIEKIKTDLKKDLVEKKINRNSLQNEVIASLRRSINSLFDVEKVDLLKESKKKKPYVIAIIGINGSGKTTTIAKLVNLFKKNKLEPVVAACDTFRAAAIQQIEEHTDKLGVKLIKHDYGSDPAAVAFDAVEHARSKGKDVVLIDTAGRLHSNANLMAELEKVIRVAKPDLKIFVGESIAGNDVVEQVKLFNDKVGIDGIVLAKADIDEKGGAAISVSYITGKPILYLGIGQEYDDLVEFDKKKIIEQIGL